MKQLILILTGLFLATTVSAKEELKIEDRKPGVIYRNSSEHNRMNKNIYLGLRSYGVEAGYYLNRNSLIVADATINQITGSSSSSSDMFSSRSNERRIEAKNFSIYNKRFTGNSFYYRVGMEVRDVRSFDVQTENGNETGYRLAGQSYGVLAGIGNQWSFRNFNIGVDWASLSYPVYSNLSEDTSSGTAGERNVDDERKRWFENPQLTLLTVNVGFSF